MVPSARIGLAIRPYQGRVIPLNYEGQNGYCKQTYKKLIDIASGFFIIFLFFSTGRDFL